MAIGDLAVLKFRVSSGSGIYQMGFGLKALTASATWRTSVANEWNQFVAPTFFQGLAHNVSWFETRVVDVLPGTGADGVGTFDPVPDFGQVLGSQIPPQCAGVIRWKTALMGRSYRGRTFVPGMPVARTDSFSEVWSTPGFSSLLAMKNKVLQVYDRVVGTSSLAFFVIISRQHDLMPTAPIGTQVTSGYVESSIRTRRDRQRQD